MRSTIIAPLIASSALLLLANAAPHNQPTKRDFQNVYNCNVQGQAALTFDDGPFNYDQQISGELNGGKGTFFFNGNNYGCIYDYADDIIALHNAGHTLGNHGWSHKDFTTLSWDEIHDELWRVEEAFIKILGVKPKYFRPPYGNTNSLLESALQNRGYTRSFLWSADTGDSTGAPVAESQGVYDGVANSYPQPALVLNHSPVQSTADQVVPYAVGQLTGRGYQLVAVDTCLGSSGEWPYYYVQAPGQRDDTWHC